MSKIRVMLFIYALCMTVMGIWAMHPKNILGWAFGIVWLISLIWLFIDYKENYWNR